MQEKLEAAADDIGAAAAAEDEIGLGKVCSGRLHHAWRGVGCCYCY